MLMSERQEFRGRVGVSIAEAGAALNASVPTIRKLISEGQLQAIRLGTRKIIIPLSSIEELLEERE